MTSGDCLSKYYSFGLLANAMSVYSGFCSIAFGDIYTAYCALPRATLGIDILCWYHKIISSLIYRLITSVALVLAILNASGNKLPFSIGSNHVHPPAGQLVDNRHEMEEQNMKDTGN